MLVVLIRDMAIGMGLQCGIKGGRVIAVKFRGENRDGVRPIGYAAWPTTPDHSRGSLAAIIRLWAEGDKENCIGFGGCY